MLSIASTKSQKKAQRLNAVSELISIAVPNSDLPIRVAQTLTSSSVFFKKKVNRFEKMVNIFQIALSLIGIGIVVAMMFCAPAALKLSLNIIDLIYQGTLLVALTHTEILSEQSNKKK